MSRRLPPALKALLLFACYALVLAGVALLAQQVLGRPRGVGFGVTMHYALLGLCLTGALALALRPVLHTLPAITLTGLVWLSMAALLFPGTGPGLAAYTLLQLAGLALCVGHLLRRPR